LSNSFDRQGAKFVDYFRFETLKKIKVANTSTFSRSLQRENRATGGLDAEFLPPQTSSLATSSSTTQAGVPSRPISILFDASHKNLYTTLNGYKKLHRRLRASYEVSSTRDELTPADLIDHDLVVICAPASAFENSELAALHAFVSRGGSVLCLGRAGNAVGGGAITTDEESGGSGAVPGGGDLTTTRERVKQQGNSRSQSTHSKAIIRDDMNDGNVLSNDKSGTSAAYLNTFLSHYGIKINNDCVIRAVFHKYLHPKECFVSKGCASIQFGKAIAKLHGRSKVATLALSNARGDSIPPSGGSDDEEDDEDDDEGGKGGRRSKTADGIEFIYPRGASVVISKPAIPLLTSGFVSYPVNKTICAVFQAPTSTTQQRSFSSSSTTTATTNTSTVINGGRVAVLGSSDMFSDDFISKECNGAIADALFRWLLQPSMLLRENDGKSNLAINDEKMSIDMLLSNIIPTESTNSSSTISKRKQDEMTGKASKNVDEDSIKNIHIIPDTTSLAERLRGCIQESEPLPRDFTKLFDLKLYGFSPLMTTEAVALFDKLGVKHEPLTLIPPQFECPLPPLRPAVFPPQMREPLPPALELFDLDEHFASEKARLAQLTNKCGDEDLEYYVRECGHILGVSQRLQAMSNLSSVSSSLSSSSTGSSSSTTNEGSLPMPFKFGESRLRGSIALQPQQQLLLQQQQQQQPSAIQVLAFVFKSIVNYKKLTQEPEPDVIQASFGYTGGEKSSKEGLNNIAVVPGGVALRQNVGAGGLGAGVAAKYKE
jgi:intraflagellar transport protein 52